jgi:uroporphyrinogen decarboxylase
VTKPLIDVLSGHRQSIPPIWFMRQAGRYLAEYREIRTQAGSFLNLCYSPELAAEVTLQPVRRFGFDAAILFADILVVPHALGQNLRFAEGEGPVLEPIRDRNALRRLAPAQLAEASAPIMETVRQVRAKLPDRCTLIGFAGAPWTVATYMVEGGSSRSFEVIRMLGYQDCELIDSIVAVLVEATTEYLSAQVTAGAETLQIFDTWAGVLPEPDLERWCIAPTREIVRRLRLRHGKVPIIGFPRGIGASLPHYAAETGVNAVSLDSTVPLSWAAKELPAGVAVQGNLDPMLLRAGGEPMHREIRRILAAFAHRALIFNLGHGILPTTPPDHVAEAVAVVRQG